MRNLVYRLTNGTIVKTYKEAVASGQGYKAEMVNIEEPLGKLPVKREAMLKKFGYVSADLIHLI